MTKKKILFILPFIPYPLVSGGHQALFNGIKAIIGDYDVYLTFEADNTSEYREAESEFISLLPKVTLLPLLHTVPNEIIPQPRKYDLLWCLKNRFWSFLLRHLERNKKQNVTPINPCDYWVNSLRPANKDFAIHLTTLFNKIKFDVAQIEMPWMIGMVYNIPDGIKKIFVHHELAFVRHKLEIEDLGESPELFAYSDFCKMIEVSLLNKYDAVVTLSETDKQKLQEEGVLSRIESSFAIVDTDGCNEQLPFDKRLSFLGSNQNPPNYQGLLWFLNNCWNRIKSIDPEYQLNVIGNWPSDIISEISSQFSDVHFLGYVKDLKDAIAGTVMIVPILIGSGIRMKILEAAACRVPIVSTTVGAEGLPVINRVNGLIADTPEGFVQSVLSLESQELRDSLVNSAFEMVHERYSLEALVKNRVNIVEKVLGIE